MTSRSGGIPPLHNRFNESESLKFIRNRYRKARDGAEAQVSALQQDDDFQSAAKGYYARGYKDWLIVLCVLNCMINWIIRERGWDRSPKGIKSAFTDKLDELIAACKGRVFGSDLFLFEDEMERQFRIHPHNLIQTYGFEPRLEQYETEDLERFFRERMKHFELDIPHEPMFGSPQGDWPEIDYCTFEA